MQLSEQEIRRIVRIAADEYHNLRGEREKIGHVDGRYSTKCDNYKEVPPEVMKSICFVGFVFSVLMFGCYWLNKIYKKDM